MHAQSIDDFYTFLRSQESSRQFLQKCYKQIDGVDADVKSYDNSSTFLAYLEHGLAYYEKANELDLFLKPLLYFYGMGHLLKACIMAVRPDYPESAALLAHGVSARKRKKKAYTFLNDEVSIQSKGLFRYVSTHLFDLQQTPFTKIKMDTLLRNIPELTMFYTWQGDTSMVRTGIIEDCQMQFPQHLLDGHQVTAHAFFNKIQRFLPENFKTNSKEHCFEIELTQPLKSETGPFKIHETEQGIYFPAQREHVVAIPEVLIHYLLLYNLSMLSRYEPVWWEELITSKPDFDYPIVKGFLDCTADKMLLTLGRYLLNLYTGKQDKT